MPKSKKARYFSNSERIEIVGTVKAARESGKKLKEACAEVGVNASVYGRWARQIAAGTLTRGEVAPDRESSYLLGFSTGNGKPKPPPAVQKSGNGKDAEFFARLTAENAQLRHDNTAMRRVMIMLARDAQP